MINYLVTLSLLLIKAYVTDSKLILSIFCSTDKSNLDNIVNWLTIFQVMRLSEYEKKLGYLFLSNFERLQ